MYKLKTIDVWDTLVRRKCHPEFAKISTAKSVYLSEDFEVKSEFTSFWDIYHERLQSEIRLANSSVGSGFDNEYKIEEVIYDWLTVVLTNSPSRSDANKLVDIEFGFEIDVTYPDPTIREFSDAYSSSETIFLSDFYMSASSLKRLLEHHGIDSFVPNGISSCDSGLNKKSGRLFQSVQRKKQVEAHEHIHIGDSMLADVDAPRRLGIDAHHYLPDEEHEKRNFLESLYHDRTKLFLHIRDQLSAEKVTKDVAGFNLSNGFCFGLSLSPLVVGFCLNVAEQCLKNGLRKVFFLSREGEFLYKIWRQLFPKNQLCGLDLPEPVYLEVSRRSTFFASLREISVNELKRLWLVFSSQSMNQLFKSLDLELNAFDSYLKKYRIDPNKVLSEPWRDSNVRSLFTDVEFCKTLREESKSRRGLLQRYLASKGWDGGKERYATVDIGWRGSIQDNLSHMYPETKVYGYYLGLRELKAEQPRNAKKFAYCFDCNSESIDEYRDLLDAVSPLEILLSSTGETVSRYGEIEGNVVAIREQSSNVESTSNLEFVHECQRGIDFSMSEWSFYVHSHVISAEELRSSAVTAWANAIRKPYSSFAEQYASTEHNEIFGCGEVLDKSKVPSILQIAFAPFVSGYRTRLLAFLRQNQWPEGVSARSDLKFLHKSLLVNVIRLARFYKRNFKRG